MARGHYLAAAVSGIAAHNGHQAARLKGMGNSHTPGWARAVLIPTSLASAAIHVAATPVLIVAIIGLVVNVIAFLLLRAGSRLPEQ